MTRTEVAMDVLEAMKKWFRAMTGVEPAPADLARFERQLRKFQDEAPATARLERRQVLCAEKGLVLDQHADQSPALVRATADAEARVRAVQVALSEAEAARLSAVIAERDARFAKDMAVGALDAELRATADPRIAAFRGELVAMLDQVRKVEPFANKNLGMFGRVLSVTTTGPSMKRRAAAIVAAIGSLDDLQLEALSGAEVAARIEGMRAAIPAVAAEDVEPRKLEAAS